jgi:hypothetical protein
MLLGKIKKKFLNKYKRLGNTAPHKVACILAVKILKPMPMAGTIACVKTITHYLPLYRPCLG